MQRKRLNPFFIRAVIGSSGSALSAGYIDADGKNRIAVAYVGEDGIEPDTWYRVDKNGKWVKE